MRGFARSPPASEGASKRDSDPRGRGVEEAVDVFEVVRRFVHRGDCGRLQLRALEIREGHVGHGGAGISPEFQGRPLSHGLDHHLGRKPDHGEGSTFRRRRHCFEEASGGEVRLGLGPENHCPGRLVVRGESAGRVENERCFVILTEVGECEDEMALDMVAFAPR